MNRKVIMLFLFNFISITLLLSQPNTDKILFELENYQPFKIKGWEYATKSINENSLMESNNWKPFSGDFSTDDSCKWFRANFIIPETIANHNTKDERLIIKIEADGFCDVFIDGNYITSFNNLKGEKKFIAFEKAIPLSNHNIFIKLRQSTIISRFFGATIEPEIISSTLSTIDDLKLSIQITKLLTQNPKDFLKYKKFSINQSKVSEERLKELRDLIDKACSEIDIQSLKQKKYNAFNQSVQKAYEIMNPISKFAKEYTIYVSGNAHIDAAWLWRWKESIDVAKYTFLQQLKLMDEYPEFIFSQSSSVYYEWMQKFYPDIFKRIKEKVKTGNWDIVGGSYLEPDCNLISGESWARQLLMGQSYFLENFGDIALLGWNPDSFGYNWNIPQFYNLAGIKAFITQKISWNDTNEFPYHLFWWTGVDGSKILTYFPMSGYVNSLDLNNLIGDLKQSEANTGRKDVLILYGFGDHGGGPERFMLERVLKFRENKFFPNIKFCKPYDYLKTMSDDYLKTIPVWNDELYLEYHRGTYTTQAANKAGNRRSEFELASAEKLSSIATLYGKEYPKNNFFDAWQKTLFNQFHDILPGSSINAVYQDSKEDYEFIKKIYNNEQINAIDYIAKLINSNNIKGDPFIIFNQANWLRTDICKISLPEKYQNKKFSILDENNNSIPYQISDNNSIVFIAKDIPSLGYKIYSISDNTNNNITDKDLAASNNSIENKYFNLMINPNTGNISSIFDKVNKKEILLSEGNLLQLFEDRPTMYDAWEILYTGVKWDLNKADEVSLVEKGPIFAKIRVKKSFLEESKIKSTPTTKFPSSFFTQDIILYNDIPRIDIELHADWWEERILAKVAFPININNNYATYEIPNGAIKRPTTRNNSWEKARYEVPALTWADLSNNEYGVSLLNIDKYGHDTEGNTMRLTLLRAPIYPDPHADRGKHKTIYSLYPHKGSWENAGTPNRAFELNNPLITKFISKQQGKLPLSHSFMSVKNDNIIISAIKKAETSNSLIIRLYESTGKEQATELALPFTPKSVYETDLLENNKTKLETTSNTLLLKFKPFETKTIKAEY